MKELKIYFTSDVHGFFSPIDYATGDRAATGLACCFPGFEKDGNTLIIDGGDTLQGSPFTYYLHKTDNSDCVPAKIMNAGRYDFYTLGNHDFNYGKQALEQFIALSNARCLCANVKGLEGVEEYTVVTLENGLRVGLTGVVTHHVNIWEKPENLRGITISEPVPAARTALEKLKAEGAELTVCIYHGGFECDLDTGASLSDTDENQGCLMCRELDFDIMLSGHQHLPIENRSLSGTHICQTPDKAKKYIALKATINGAERRINSELIPAGEAPDTAAAVILEPYDALAAVWLDTPVGHLSVPLAPRAHLDMAINGCEIANFFNQVQLDASGADISCTSLANEVKGFVNDVSVRDVAATYVYPNTLVTLEVDRAVLKTALERCAEYFDFDENGEVRVSEVFLKPKVEHYNFDYFTGIDVVFDIRRPVGDRVVSIMRDGMELPADRKYTLCMNNYRSSGTGGYEVFKACRRVSEKPQEIAEIIMDYISEHNNIVVDVQKHLEVRL